MQSGHCAELQRGSVLFRTRFAEGSECSGWLDSHLVGWIAGGRLDERGSVAQESRIQAGWVGKRKSGRSKGKQGIQEGGSGRAILASDRTLQWNDCAADSLRDQGRDLVSRRIQRRPPQTISHALSGYDQKLAQRLGRRRLHIFGGAARSLG